MKAVLSNPSIDVSGYRVRRDKVDKAGRVTLRYRGKLYHLGVGNAYAGWRVLLLVAGLDVQIIAMDDASPLRHLTLDPSVDYYPHALKGPDAEIPDRALGQMTGVLASGPLSESELVPLRAGATS